MILLLSVIFAIINFGIIFASQIGLNSAARDASRAGVVKALDPGEALSCGAVAVAARNNGGPFPTNPTAVKVSVTGPGGSLRIGSETLESKVTGSTAKPCTGAAAGNNQLLVELLY